MQNSCMSEKFTFAYANLGEQGSFYNLEEKDCQVHMLHYLSLKIKVDKSEDEDSNKVIMLL